MSDLILQKLPTLPIEIVSKILYKDKGLEHPTAKMIKEVEETTDWRSGDIWLNKYFSCPQKTFSWNDGDKTHITYNIFAQYFMNLEEREEHWKKYEWAPYIQPLEKSGIIINDIKSDVEFEYGSRIITEDEYKKKELQDYLDQNNIKWYKSWTKKRLMKQIMSF